MSYSYDKIKGLTYVFNRNKDLEKQFGRKIHDSCFRMKFLKRVLKQFFLCFLAQKRSERVLILLFIFGTPVK